VSVCQQPSPNDDELIAVVAIKDHRSKKKTPQVSRSLLYSKKYLIFTLHMSESKEQEEKNVGIQDREDIRRVLEALRAGEGEVLPPDTIVVWEMGEVLVESSVELALLHQYLSECSARAVNRTFTLRFEGEEEEGPDWYQVSAIASLLNQIPNQLKSLKLGQIKLLGDIDPLIQALQQQRLLEDLNLHCEISSGLIALADSLSPLPNLKAIFCTFLLGMDYQEKAAAAASFARVSALRNLTLWHLQGHKSDCQDLFLEIQEHASLEKFHVHGYLSAENVQYLANMLQGNSSLHFLNIGMIDKASVPLVATALETNSTLKELHFRQEALVTNSVSPALEALVTNSVSPEDDSAEFQETLRKINFYLGLNRDFQRKRLLSSNENATIEDWVNMIVSAKDKTDVLFYYFLRNLSLITTANVDCAALAGQIGIYGNASGGQHGKRQNKRARSGKEKKPRSN
jgi:hypothetical protein